MKIHVLLERSLKHCPKTWGVSTWAVLGRRLIPIWSKNWDTSCTLTVLWGHRPRGSGDRLLLWRFSWVALAATEDTLLACHIMRCSSRCERRGKHEKEREGGKRGGLQVHHFFCFHKGRSADWWCAWKEESQLTYFCCNGGNFPTVLRGFLGKLTNAVSSDMKKGPLESNHLIGEQRSKDTRFFVFMLGWLYIPCK